MFWASIKVLLFFVTMAIDALIVGSIFWLIYIAGTAFK